MSKFKEMKQKIKENKGKIIAGTIVGISVIGGVAYIVISKDKKIKLLKDRVEVNEDDIQLLKDRVEVMCYLA